MKTLALRAFASIVQGHSVETIIGALKHLRADDRFQTIGWQRSFARLSRVFATGKPELTIIKSDGNSKLPFYAFSSLPGVTCPGAGDCLKFCYSFRAWRYPDAFARQIQNAFLMRFYPDTIQSAFNAIPDGSDFRLYVDGDFSSVSDVSFWFSLLLGRESIKAYGYSKSFSELLAYTGDYPSNYALNVSSGHNHSDETVNLIKDLPITRGEFRAVSVGFKVKSNMHGTKAVNDALRIKSNERIFPCPGKCGSCTGKGHACGMLDSLKGKVIAIAIH
jgi:hypothetical protein